METHPRINALLEFIKEDPGDASSKYMLSLEYIKAGQYQEALQWMTDVHENHPQYLPNYYHFGKLQERLGVLEKAVQIYSEGMTVARENNDQHTYMELKGAFEMLTM